MMVAFVALWARDLTPESATSLVHEMHGMGLPLIQWTPSLRMFQMGMEGEGVVDAGWCYRILHLLLYWQAGREAEDLGRAFERTEMALVSEN